MLFTVISTSGKGLISVKRQPLIKASSRARRKEKFCRRLALGLEKAKCSDCRVVTGSSLR